MQFRLLNMFTGIVATVGRISQASANQLGIEAPGITARAAIGDSVAVNGACLTVTRLDAGTFFADVVPETLKRTNLGLLKLGDPVNLERSLTLQQSVDGHLVQGHVDSTASVRAVTAVESGVEIEIELPESVSPYLAEKGSVAVDGTSLTVAWVGQRSFTVALIPHTLALTVAGQYAPGSVVNLEADLLARYVYRVLATRKPSE